MGRGRILGGGTYISLCVVKLGIHSRGKGGNMKGVDGGVQGGDTGWRLSGGRGQWGYGGYKGVTSREGG